jgi:TRAP-type uncharacterized transport system substrate-binding protein
MRISRVPKPGKIKLLALTGTLLTASLVISTAGCTAEPVKLTMVTGGTGGTYYPIGTAIAGVNTDVQTIAVMAMLATTADVP